MRTIEVFGYMIKVSVTPIKYYTLSSIRYWLFYFRRMANVKAFSLRICGVHILVKKKDAIYKLINKWKTIRERGRNIEG